MKKTPSRRPFHAATPHTLRGHRSLFVLFILSLSLCACSVSNSSIKQKRHFFSPMGRAKQFALPSSQGDRKSLKEYRGSPVLLHFWATWCMTCIPEMRALEEVHRDFGEKGLKVIAISIDSLPGPARLFFKRQRLHFDLLYDQSNSVFRSYGNVSVPVTFLISADGSLLRFDDPDTGEIVHKIEGSRSWGESSHRQLLEEFIQYSP